MTITKSETPASALAPTAAQTDALLADAGNRVSSAIITALRLGMNTCIVPKEFALGEHLRATRPADADRAMALMDRYRALVDDAEQFNADMKARVLKEVQA